ncbi:MAG: DUF2142 domain-containing protein [Marmoricola sp.]
MSHRRRITVLAGAGFLLLQLGWMLVIAPNFGIDEFDHSLRSSSVADGHWSPGQDLVAGKDGRGYLIAVRADVARTAHAACAARSYTGKYNCTPKSDPPGDEVVIASAAGRYNPLYYAVVGNVAKPFTGEANLIAMRVTTAVLAALLFAAVVWLTVGAARTVWPLLGCLLAALPTTVYSTAIATPNGLEIIAGLGVWASLAVVVGGARGVQRRGTAYGLLAVSVTVLANTHTLGLLWLALIGLTTVIAHGLGTTLRALLPTRRSEYAAAVLAVAGVVFELGWVLTSGVNDPSMEHRTYPGSAIPYVVDGLLLWPLQAIGAVPMRDDPAPGALYVLVITVLVVVAALVLRRTRLRSRSGLALTFVAVASFAVPAALTVQAFGQMGAAWQGRYGMPFTVGLLLLGAAVLDGHERPVAHAPLFASVAVPALVAAHLIGQISVRGTMHRDATALASIGWSAPDRLLLGVIAALALACWFSAIRSSVTAPAPSPVAAGPPRHALVRA